jgi:hypothetical protein
MGSPKKHADSSDRVALYDKLIATNPKIERKGAPNPYTSLNGNSLPSRTNRKPWPSGCLSRSASSF